MVIVVMVIIIIMTALPFGTDVVGAHIYSAQWY
jgi:hypothetical protein